MNLYYLSNLNFYLHIMGSFVCLCVVYLFNFFTKFSENVVSKKGKLIIKHINVSIYFFVFMFNLKVLLNNYYLFYIFFNICFCFEIFFKKHVYLFIIFFFLLLILGFFHFNLSTNISFFSIVLNFILNFLFFLSFVFCG